MGTVEFRNISKAFEKDRQVIKDLNLSIRDGEFCVLLGPSGCGKTTILRMIAGLENISDGQILIDSKVINAVAPKDRDISMVFQNYALYPHMSVYQNIEYPLKLRRLERDLRRQKVRQVAALLDIENVLDRYPRQLSGGQKQRVAVGRALVRRPKVYLFDEPLSNLDARLRNTMRSELKLLHRRLGITIIYVTHDQVEALTLADKIVLLKDGVIQQEGSPQQIYQHPQNTFVGGFIGSPPMNLFRVKINGNPMFGNCRIPVECVSGNTELIIGIRPEDLILKKGVVDTFIEAKQILEEPVGKEVHIHFKPIQYELYSDQFVVISSDHREADHNAVVQIFFNPHDLKIYSGEDHRLLHEGI